MYSVLGFGPTMEVHRLGLEPRTYWLKANCSTIELTVRCVVGDSRLLAGVPTSLLAIVTYRHDYFTKV